VVAHLLASAFTRRLHLVATTAARTKSDNYDRAEPHDNLAQHALAKQSGQDNSSTTTIVPTIIVL
jgi:hypothetical protein